MGRKHGFNTPFAGLKKKVKAVEQAPKPVAPPKPAPEPNDIESFEQAMAGVTRLDSRPRIEPQKTTASRAVDDETLALQEFKAFAQGAGSFDVGDTGEVVWGRAPGVSHKILRAVREGKHPFRRYLDLHGHTQDEAHAELKRFIAKARRDGERCILVITGKGMHSPHQTSVLRQSLPRWLGRGSLRAHVLCYATAKRSDGGPGAFYVLLRRAGVPPFGISDDTQ